MVFLFNTQLLRQSSTSYIVVFLEIRVFIFMESRLAWVSPGREMNIFTQWRPGPISFKGRRIWSLVPCAVFEKYGLEEIGATLIIPHGIFTRF